jgi:hypothetical protein
MTQQVKSDTAIAHVEHNNIKYSTCLNIPKGIRCYLNLHQPYNNQSSSDKALLANNSAEMLNIDTNWCNYYMSTESMNISDLHLI